MIKYSNLINTLIFNGRTIITNQEGECNIVQSKQRVMKDS